ncbi:MAG: hypothetical protein A2Z20_12495, partial [Bdellovibrionales bacterium RBG_16_40_8]
TPNPQTMKFRVATQIADETVFFEDPEQTVRSPLAQKLFGFPWAKAIMIGPDFVTITKQEWVEWAVLADPLTSLIAEHLQRDEGVLIDMATLSSDDNDSPIIKKIKEILNRDIRPVVAADGGDIVFSRYVEGRLYLHLRGACSGCPSSVITLKNGIEVRMKEVIPEIVEVVSEN